MTAATNLDQSSRVEALDYLRGILAFSVMVYHYAVRSGVALDAGTLLGRLGIYAVSTFYILSGLSLGIAYRGRMRHLSDVAKYGIKRVFRIFPLYWVTVTLHLGIVVAYSLYKGVPYEMDWGKLFLNYSLLFGFINPTAYYPTGAWSIGNEMVFYAFFPLLLFLAERHRAFFWLALVISVMIGAMFAGDRLTPDLPLTQQWATYVNPFNQLPLFVTGLAISLIPTPKTTKAHALGFSFIAIGCLAFHFTPAAGDQIVLVTGLERLLFSAACVIVVLGLFVSRIRVPRWRPLSLLGEGSYSVYLLHPVVSSIVVPVVTRIGLAIPTAYVAAGVVTLLSAWFSFRYLERPMMAKGKQLSSRILTPPVLLQTRVRSRSE